MGLIRFLLALAVVGEHTGGIFHSHIIGGLYAVKTFFVISGFYMALILNEKYLKTENSYKLFITNRILRLYPLYFIIFAFSLVVYILLAQIAPIENPWYSWTHLTHSSWALPFFLIVSNLTMLGMDLPYFIKGIPNCYVVPQAWTISLEFMFYFLAPFLVRYKTKYLMLLLLISILVKVILIYQGRLYDPWSYRFFPVEIAFFLLGIFSYRIYEKIKDYKISKIIPVISLITILCFVVNWLPIYKYLTAIAPALSIPKDYPSFIILYFLLLLIGLPFIFLYTKNLPFDRWIGEFSYPIYILHFTVMYTLRALSPTIAHSPYFGWITAILCFIITLILLYFIIYPLERFREHRILSHKM